MRSSPSSSPGTYQQLVIYFSGHGHWKNDAELWLLSEAPADANAAVSWAETAEFAKDCGIPNVVMISDACRSIPLTPRAMKVRGSIVFPNDEVPRDRAKVDKFMAATIGTAALEVPFGAAGEKINAFTHCFLRAFEEPDLDMTRVVDEDGNSIKVVPNRRLGKYIQREVLKLLAQVNIALDQKTDAEILSDDDAYIGVVRPKQPGAGATEIVIDSLSVGADPLSADVAGDISDMIVRGGVRSLRPPKPPVVHLRDVAAAAFGEALNEPKQVTPREKQAIESLARQSGFNDAVAQAGVISDIRHFETQTGFAVLGAEIQSAIVSSGEELPVLSRGGGTQPGLVRIDRPSEPACTVLLQFTGGRGTALAALRGFIGHVLVEGNQVINVNYVPSDNSDRWGNYQHRRDSIDRLRAAAAAAVRMGVFRLDDKRKPESLPNVSGC